jgi:hypothetical protein
MIPNAVCGVLLYKEAYEDIGDILAPYVSEGPIGKYIYCKTAQEHGSFLDMTFTPELCADTVKEDMLISVPLRYVKFMTTSSASLPMGFGSHKGKD